MNNDCAVLINSCDAFEDTWRPFFQLLNEYWPDCPYPVFLNTEEKDFSDNTITVLNHSCKMNWSDRVIDSLKKIKAHYIIVLLDDFFIDQRVNSKRIAECVDALKKNRDIAVFSFAPSKWVDIDDQAFPGFELRPVYGEYRFNMQAALWRKKDLLRILNHDENPWQAENYGNFRARVLMPGKRFYAAKKDEQRVIHYEYGGAIHRGMWTEATPALLEKHGIDGIDFSVRGFDPRPTSDWEKLELDEPVATPPARSLKIKLVELLYALNILKFNKK